MYIAHTELTGYFLTALISTLTLCTILHLLKTLIEGEWPCIICFWQYLYKLVLNSWFWDASSKSWQLKVLLLLAEIWAMLIKFPLSDAPIISSCVCGMSNNRPFSFYFWFIFSIQCKLYCNICVYVYIQGQHEHIDIRGGNTDGVARWREIF